mgnify:CR=1 FL=1
MTLIEASRLGHTLEQAASARVLESAAGADIEARLSIDLRLGGDRNNDRRQRKPPERKQLSHLDLPQWKEQAEGRTGTAKVWLHYCPGRHTIFIGVPFASQRSFTPAAPASARWRSRCPQKRLW